MNLGGISLSSLGGRSEEWGWVFETFCWDVASHQNKFSQQQNRKGDGEVQ